ncbi:MAG: sensor histidine kinase [Pseudomonadota bacterium]
MKTKIIYKFLLFVLPLVIFSIILTSLILTWTSHNYALKTINQDYENILKSCAGQIRLYMENARKGLDSLALVIAATKLDQWQKQISLTAFTHTSPQFISVSLISRDGTEIQAAGTERTHPGRCEREILAKAFAGQSAVSPVLITKEGLPYLCLAVPVKKLGQAGEVLWAELNLKSVWDILEGIRIGQTGQVYILDRSGRIIGHREIDRVIKQGPRKDRAIMERISQTEAPVQWMEEEGDQQLYCLGYYISGLDWIVVLSQTYAEIYTYLYDNAHWAVFMTCFICLAAILLGLNRVRRFLLPIQDLHRQVKSISEGDLDKKVSIDAQDEIGDLGVSFNQMTDSLKNYIKREIETAKELVHAKNLAILGSASSKVTHEVGNMLNNIGLVVSILKDEASTSRGKKALEILEKDSVRVRSFIQDFLQFARKPELHLVASSVDDIIREVLFVYGPEAERRGIVLGFEWQPGIPAISIDYRQIYQVFNNMIKNSLDAIGSGGKILIEGSISGENLRINMTDSGSGIDPGIMEKIFEPFFTTKRKSGTGLGLSIVKGIIEAHRGRIECRSDPEEGTVFTIYLPVR